jgi:DNA-binding response OmpR family regulator
MARILLIEEQRRLRANLAENLALAGHTVLEAADGREGLDRFRRGGADLVVRDLLMPETEGFEMLRASGTSSHPRR